MTVTLDLNAELERQIREMASQSGLDPQTVIVQTLEARFCPPDTDAPHLTPEEADLVQNLNLGFTAEQWDRYHALIAKRRAETITPDEQAELIRFSDQLETANARRFQDLATLARLRHTTVDALMRTFGFSPPSYV